MKTNTYCHEKHKQAMSVERFMTMRNFDSNGMYEEELSKLRAEIAEMERTRVALINSPEFLSRFD